MLVIEEPTFAFDAAAVTGKGAVGTDDPMTGEHDGDGIGSICGSDGTDCGGMADLARELTVRSGASAGNAAQSAPDLLLK